MKGLKMETGKKQIDKKQLVGRIGTSYYICDYLFEYASDFKGATATVLEPVSRASYEEQTDPEGDYAQDYYRENWIEAVKAGLTEYSLAEYTEDVLSSNGDEAIYDLSGYDYWDMIREAVPELTEEDCPVFNCIGGGRSFDKDMIFDEVYNQELLDEIIKYEN